MKYTVQTWWNSRALCNPNGSEGNYRTQTSSSAALSAACASLWKLGRLQKQPHTHLDESRHCHQQVSADWSKPNQDRRVCRGEAALRRDCRWSASADVNNPSQFRKFWRDDSLELVRKPVSWKQIQLVGGRSKCAGVWSHFDSAPSAHIDQQLSCNI